MTPLVVSSYPTPKANGKKFYELEATARSTGMLVATCWCERTYGLVTLAMLRLEQTFACGRRGCNPPTICSRTA